jgi:hypothetical protein
MITRARAKQVAKITTVLRPIMRNISTMTVVVPWFISHRFRIDILLLDWHHLGVLKITLPLSTEDFGRPMMPPA